jgi:NAD(P)-dependent dehydrogenase (short-subunit alcohol dehydrogenase family)
VVGAIHEIDEETASRGMAVNFGGVFLGTQMAVRAMLDGGGGAIVNVSSLQARFGVRGFPLYAAAKGAVVSLTRQVAAEYADRGIRCNAVAPGVIQTPMNERLLRQRGHGRRSLEALSPMRRLGRAEEVAAAVAFLLGDEATFITGEVLAVDGGQQVIPPNHFLRGEPD